MQYFGGKTKISNEISNFLNSKIKYNQNFVSVFLGGGIIESKITMKGGKKILNDKHPYLISMYRALQSGWIPPSEITREQYYFYKEYRDTYPHIAGFVGFACSFAGKWWGGYAQNSKQLNYAQCSKRSLLKKFEGLRESEFICSDFQDLSFSDSIIYCDPPYKGTSPYCKKILGEFPYETFLNWCMLMSKNNNEIYISEYKHNVDYSRFRIVWERNTKSNIRNKKNKVNKTVEVLIIPYE